MPNDRPPAKFKLLNASKSHMRNLPTVSTLDIFIPSTNTFHPDGLFSAEIFGSVISKQRMEVVAKIDLHYSFITPMIYKMLMNSAPFKTIVNGTKTYRWDDKKKYFFEDPNGETGISFLLEHIEEMRIPEEGASSSRLNLIRLIDKYRHEGLLVDVAIVIPAGIRDYEINKEGQAEQDEINDIYRNILRHVSLLPKRISKGDRRYDHQLFKVQQTLLELFKHISTITDGKKKFTRGKFASRAVHNVTRNILTSIPSDNILHLDEDRLDIDEVQVGLFQFMKGIGYKAIHYIQHNPIVQSAKVDSDWFVIDKKTLKRRMATPLEEFKYNSILGSVKGLVKFTNTYSTEYLRNLPIEAGDSYLGYIYDNPKDKNVYVVNDLEEFPKGINKKFTRPMSMTDLFTISLMPITNEVLTTNTRYPVDNPGSVQINKPFVLVTREFHDVIVTYPNGETVEVKRFPMRESEFINGVATHSAAWGPHGADSDGDAITTVFVIERDAVAQGKKIIDTKNLAYYKTPDGRLKLSPSDEVSDILFTTLG